MGPAPRALPLALLVVAGCQSDVFAPSDAAPDARPLAPLPPVYSEWWGEIEACAGRTHPMSRVNWYVAPEGTIVQPETGMRAWGLWMRGSNTIIVEDRLVLMAGLVRHEMLHAVLRDDSHDSPLFQRGNSCGVHAPNTPLHHLSPR